MTNLQSVVASFIAWQSASDSLPTLKAKAGDDLRVLFNRECKVSEHYDAYNDISKAWQADYKATRKVDAKAAARAWQRAWQFTELTKPKAPSVSAATKAGQRAKQGEVMAAALEALGVAELNNDTAALVAEKLNKPLDKLTPTERTLATKAIALAEKAATKAARDEAKAMRQADYEIVKAAIASDDEMLAACLKAVVALNKKRETAKTKAA